MVTSFDVVPFVPIFNFSVNVIASSDSSVTNWNLQQSNDETQTQVVVKEGVVK